MFHLELFTVGCIILLWYLLVIWFFIACSSSPDAYYCSAFRQGKKLGVTKGRLASGQEIFSQKLILDPCIILGSESMPSLTDQQKETLRVLSQ
ncbi:unnamed protein product [Brassica oleracea var. botrytis]